MGSGLPAARRPRWTNHPLSAGVKAIPNTAWTARSLRMIEAGARFCRLQQNHVLTAVVLLPYILDYMQRPTRQSVNVFGTAFSVRHRYSPQRQPRQPPTYRAYAYVRAFTVYN